MFEAFKETDVMHKLKVALTQFLMNIELRGLMTMLGFRKTVGSQEVPWPDLRTLYKSFNAPHTVLTDE